MNSSEYLLNNSMNDPFAEEMNISDNFHSRANNSELFILGVNNSLNFVKVNEAVHVLQQFHKIVSCVFGSFFGIVGITGNLISCYAWRRRKMNSPSSNLLMTLKSLNDVIVCLLYLTIEPLPLILPNVVRSFPYGLYFSFLGLPFFSLFTYASNWLMVLVTADKFFKICRSDIIKQPVLKIKFPFVVIALYFLCLLMGIPNFFKVKKMLKLLSIQHESGFSPTPLGGMVWFDVWEIWIHCWFLMALPILVTTVASLLIVKRIKQKTSKYGRISQLNNTTTGTILKTVNFFNFRIAVQCIAQCIILAFVSDKRISHELVWVMKVGKILNCSVNVFIYSKYNLPFRHAVTGIFRRKTRVGVLSDPRNNAECNQVQTELITKI